MDRKTPRHTPLHARHVALSARLVEFAGFLMPVQYRGLVEEHHAVRNAAGLFDVSHMGELQFRGPGALATLDRLTPSEVRKLEDGHALYTVLLRPDGGIVDDVIVYRLAAEDYLMVVNASNRDKDHAWCRDHLGADPPVGPSVDDLATALADLAPFRVTSPPEDVSIYGYGGQHLELTVPNLAVSDNVFTGCEDGKLMSWIGAIDTTPGDAYYGYTGPAYTEEFWLLDVDGDRLMIAAEQSPGSPPKDIEELRDILHSIQIET